MECKTGDSPSSSTDSCSGQPPPAALSTASSGYRPAIRGELSTDLHLGLSLSCSSIQTDNSTPSTPRSALTTTATATAKTAAAYQRGSGGHGQRSLFVKVYMEGVPIGRKLDLLLLDGYDGLLAQLGRMFKASITYPDVMGGHQVVLGEKQQQARHVLTYEDQEGDWMMVGDVPWELFLTSVKKLRIARADKVLH